MRVGRVGRRGIRGGCDALVDVSSIGKKSNARRLSSAGELKLRELEGVGGRGYIRVSAGVVVLMGGGGEGVGAAECGSEGRFVLRRDGVARDDTVSERLVEPVGIHTLHKRGRKEGVFDGGQRSDTEGEGRTGGVIA